jgi:hypothetical protein
VQCSHVTDSVPFNMLDHWYKVCFLGLSTSILRQDTTRNQYQGLQQPDLLQQLQTTLDSLKSKVHSLEVENKTLRVMLAHSSQTTLHEAEIGKVRI